MVTRPPQDHMNVDVVAKGIDPFLLSMQKAVLLYLLEEHDGYKADCLNGVINMIDAMQDYMVDTLGMCEYEASPVEFRK